MGISAVSDSVIVPSTRQLEKEKENGERGNTLSYGAITSILCQWLFNKMTNWRHSSQRQLNVFTVKPAALAKRVRLAWNSILRHDAFLATYIVQKEIEHALETIFYLDLPRVKWPMNKGNDVKYTSPRCRKTSGRTN